MSKDREIKIIRKAKAKKHSAKPKKKRKTLKERLKKRIKGRYFVNYLACKLYKYFPKSKCSKDYERAMHCTDAMTVKGGNLTAHYCHSRICPICNNIRTARYIKAYGPTLSKVEQMYFVTLTRPNVPGHKLAQEITDLQKTWRMITNNRWYRAETKAGLIGIRKLEVTYNSDRNDYHPHFHILVSTESAAINIVKWWLNYNPKADPDAQRIVECYGDDQDSWKEIFKYTTKLVYSSKKGKKEATRKIEFEAINTICEALKNKRTMQRIGSDDLWMTEEIDEDFKDEDLNGHLDVTELGVVENEVFAYYDDKEEKVAGYASTMTGEVLIDYNYGKSFWGRMFEEAEARMQAKLNPPKREKPEDILFRDWYSLIPEHFESITSDIQSESEAIKSAIESRQNEDSKPIDTLFQPIENKDIKSLETRCNELWDLYSMQLFFNEKEAERYKQAYEAARNELIQAKGIKGIKPQGMNGTLNVNAI